MVPSSAALKFPEERWRPVIWVLSKQNYKHDRNPWPTQNVKVRTNYAKHQSERNEAHLYALRAEPSWLFSSGLYWKATAQSSLTSTTAVCSGKQKHTTPIRLGWMPILTYISIQHLDLGVAMTMMIHRVECSANTQLRTRSELVHDFYFHAGFWLSQNIQTSLIQHYTPIHLLDMLSCDLWVPLSLFCLPCQFRDSPPTTFVFPVTGNREQQVADFTLAAADFIPS